MRPSLARKPKRGPIVRLTASQALLQVHLREIGIETVPEFRFCLERRYRFDLYCERLRMGFEVNGTFQGLHGARFGGSDMEKLNLAQMLGYRVMQFTNKQVETGRAQAWMNKWIGRVWPDWSTRRADGGSAQR
jgi:very-short-patch-repair endonuclease